MLLAFDPRFIPGVPNDPLPGLGIALDGDRVQLGVVVNPVLFEDRLFSVDFGALANGPLETAGEEEKAFFDGANEGLEVDWEVGGCEGENPLLTPFVFGTAEEMDGAPNTVVAGFEPGNTAVLSVFGIDVLEVEGAPNKLPAGFDEEDPGAAPLVLEKACAKGFGVDVESPPKTLLVGFGSGGAAMPFEFTPKWFKFVIKGEPKAPVADETPPSTSDEVFVEGAPKTLADDPLVSTLDGAPKTLDVSGLDFMLKIPLEGFAD